MLEAAKSWHGCQLSTSQMVSAKAREHTFGHVKTIYGSTHGGGLQLLPSEILPFGV